MSDELFYTSAVRGLRPGTGGFCTVAATSGLGPAWQQRLEALSGYKPLYPLGHPAAAQNPVAYSHTIVTVAGQTRSVLSRAAFAGTDHTARSNKFVHHLLPTDRERGPAGPAWVMRQAGVMTGDFAGESRPLVRGRSLPMDDAPPSPAVAWQAVAGDAAWAAALARPALADPAGIVYVIYAPGTDVLALFDEALRLLPAHRRWAVTFNTYVTDPPVAPCAWRGVIANTPAAAMAKGTVIDLTRLDPSAVPTGPLAEAARTGAAVAFDFNQVGLPPVAAQADREPTEIPLRPLSPLAIDAAARPARPRQAIPSNISLADTPPERAGSNVTVAVSVLAIVLVLASVVAGTVWLLNATAGSAAPSAIDSAASPPPTPAATPAAATQTAETPGNPPHASQPSPATTPAVAEPPATLPAASQPAAASTAPAEPPAGTPPATTQAIAPPPTTAPTPQASTSPAATPSTTAPSTAAPPTATQPNRPPRNQIDLKLTPDARAIEQRFWNVLSQSEIVVTDASNLVFAAPTKGSANWTLTHGEKKTTLIVRHKVSQYANLTGIPYEAFVITFEAVGNKVKHDAKEQLENFRDLVRSKSTEADTAAKERAAANAVDVLKTQLKGLQFNVVEEQRGAGTIVLTTDQDTNGNPVRRRDNR